MRVEIRDISKRYTHRWIIRNLTYTLEAGKRYAVAGRNGSGKSTFIQLIAGYLSPSSGRIDYHLNEAHIARGDVYRHITWMAPGVDLIEDFSLLETIRYHERFKAFLPGYTPSDVIEMADLKAHQHKKMRDFSSGMKQRTKLSLAFLSHSAMILLDEPTATLDKMGRQWFQDVLRRYGKDRTVVIASNDGFDHEQCTDRLDIEQYA